jgi:hypothetical protein
MRAGPRHITSRPSTAGGSDTDNNSNNGAGGGAGGGAGNSSKIEPLSMAGKSRSLSTFAPGGILRKPSLTPDGVPASQKKRHSFSTTIATIHVIPDPNASFTSNAGSGGASADGSEAEKKKDSGVGTDGSVQEDSESDSLQSAEDQEPPRTERTESSDGPVFMKKDVHEGVQAHEETKTALSREPSFRSIASESVPVSSPTAREAPKTPDSELSEPFRNISRIKPSAPMVKAPPTFSPARKRTEIVIDRSNITGPPLELALTAINNNRVMERNRAYSAHAESRRNRAMSPELDAHTRDRAYSAGHARKEL